MEVRLKERIIFDYRMNQILEIVFPRKANISDLNFLIKIYHKDITIIASFQNVNIKLFETKEPCSQKYFPNLIS